MLTGVLLVNLGTPNSFAPRDVKRYLTQFLTDKRVIDLPYIQRNLLVRGVIVPKRYKDIAKLYSSIWTNEGSPLLVYGKKVATLLQERLGESFRVKLAMRYQNPSIQEGLESLRNVDQLIVFPLFPQYASATTGSIHEEVFRVLSKWKVIPEVRFIAEYSNHPALIEAFLARSKDYEIEKYDHVLFSYHGLPEKELQRSDLTGRCLKDKKCCEKNPKCYAAQCFKTTQSISTALNIPKERWSLSFQSRLGKAPWIRPYTDQVLELLAKEGKKKVLVFSPAFVSDCLETLEEIGCQYRDLFIERGGERLDLVAGLNDHPKWIEAIDKIIH